ncbi:MAG TPA: hypothetical protein VJ890_19595 [Vineibacter sp.]|nr:hypothetical protein [Vineibacter sp.]
MPKLIAADANHANRGRNTQLKIPKKSFGAMPPTACAPARHKAFPIRLHGACGLALQLAAEIAAMRILHAPAH